ncbi:MAG: methyltransferase domain-containing protein [Chlorobium phaeobacteroides]|jgi:hypothetical protein|nr:methyltransferase domain-containing protein [Chlorobium phaeobacteroides]
MAFNYSEFEISFRGSREEVVAKLSAYFPFVLQLGINSSTPALDLASGRGEWLELLKEHGIDAYGIDMNVDFVRYCRNNGLQVDCADIFTYLSDYKDIRYRLITGFHIIEHLTFEKQNEFLERTYEQLTDGGVLILETPNPENTVLGCCNFYNDPYHIRPVPPQLLKFLALQAGFIAPVIVKLNRYTVGTPLQLMHESIPGAEMFNQLVELVSSNFQQAPDYALIAFKNIPPSEQLLSHLENINRETENYSPRLSAELNFDEYLRIQNRTLLNVEQQSNKELQIFESLFKQKNEELQNAYEQIRQLNHKIHHIQLEYEEHEHDLKIKQQQIENEIKLTYTQIEHRDKDLQKTASLLKQRDQELHYLQVVIEQKDNELRLLRDQTQQLDHEYKRTFINLTERERELKSVYNTTAGKFIRVYKSVKKKMRKKNNQESELLPLINHFSIRVDEIVPPKNQSKSVHKVYQLLLKAQSRQRKYQ